jgi:cystathionine beta-lyase
MYLDGNRRRLAELLAEHAPGVVGAVPEATYLAGSTARPRYRRPRFFLEQARAALSDGPPFDPAATSTYA